MKDKGGVVFTSSKDGNSKSERAVTDKNSQIKIPKSLAKFHSIERVHLQNVLKSDVGRIADTRFRTDAGTCMHLWKGIISIPSPSAYIGR